jgi:AraC family transcriptional regulator
MLSYPAPAARGPIRVAQSSAQSSTLTAGSFNVSILEFAPVRLASHYHPRAALSVILDGGFTETFPRREYECVAGSMIVKPAEERHSDRMLHSRQVVVEPNEGLSDDSPLSTLFQTIRFVRDPATTAIGLRLAAEMAAPDVWTPTAVEGLTFDMLAAFGRATLDLRSSAAAPRWLRRVEERVRDANDPPSLPELGLMSGVHPGHVNRMFKRHFGCAIGEYGRRCRLERAARQLLHSSESIVSIALGAGFADQSHFTRSFRGVFRMTPGEYRAVSRPGALRLEGPVISERTSARR